MVPFPVVWTQKSGLGSGAALRMVGQTKDIVNVPNAFWFRVTGLTFIDGLNQLRLGNNNTDEGQIVVADCAFHNGSGAAILTERPCSAAANEGHALLNRGSYSTQLTVRDSKVIGCAQVPFLVVLLPKARSFSAAHCLSLWFL
eukprot:SAG22_NODE_704_length_7777_cov_6.153295_3_plen_143_part_00